MVSPVLNEHFYTSAFLVSEAPGARSRDSAVIANATGADVFLDAGLVLTDAPTVTAGGSNVGNGTITGLLLGVSAVTGAYTAAFTGSTTATITDPTGRVLGTATVGTPFLSLPEISLTLNAGGTAFAAGDTFTILALGPVGTYAPYTSTSAPANAILFNRVRVPANGSVKVAIVSRDCEVNKGELVWDSTVTASGSVLLLQARAVAALGAAGIVCR